MVSPVQFGLNLPVYIGSKLGDKHLKITVKFGRFNLSESPRIHPLCMIEYVESS